VGWVAGSDRHRTQVRQHEHTQVTRSPPMGKRCHPVLVTAQVMADCVVTEGFAVRCSMWAVGRRSTD
jgi:hypothetical protein